MDTSAHVSSTLAGRKGGETSGTFIIIGGFEAGEGKPVSLVGTLTSVKKGKKGGTSGCLLRAISSEGKEKGMAAVVSFFSACGKERGMVCSSAPPTKRRESSTHSLHHRCKKKKKKKEEV